MSDAVHIGLTPQAQALLRRMRSLPREGLMAVSRALDGENALTVAHIQRAYLSFPSSGPVVAYGLRTQTGSLRRSLRATKAVVTGQTVRSAIGGNVTRRGVNYLAVHELGAYHAARPPLRREGSKSKRKLTGMKAWNSPARGMIRRGIQDRAAAMGAACSQALLDTLRGGKS
jgi:hypothetical protein